MGVLKAILKKIYIAYLRFKPLIAKNEKIKNRRYIHPELGVEGFLNSIINLDYVVLRWFENLPFIEKGEDIDILVSDNDLASLNEFLKGTKGYGIACDIYTCGGLPGTDFKSVPYFPAKISDDIIKNSVLYKGTIKVPSNVHHLLTMIYHIVYHKGFESGITSKYELPANSKKPDHNFLEIIKELSKKAKIELPKNITLENLDTFLHKNGWRPQNDTLNKLSKHNDWIKLHFFSSEKKIAPYWKGFNIFIIREKGIPFLQYIKTLLQDDGFDLLYEKEIPVKVRKSAAHKIRGGNWSRGPWATSGGEMAYVIATYDLHPVDVDESLMEKHPGITNARVPKTKIKIRNQINSLLEKKEWCNVIHSTDNPTNALEYSSLLIPEKIKSIESKIIKLYKSFETPFPVIKNLSRKSRRAKVELVSYNSSEAICKTFKPNRERFMKREILARELKGNLNSISEILETGKNYIIFKKYEDILDKKCILRQPFKKEKYLPLPVIKEARKILSHYRSLGYELIDFFPSNFIYDKKEGIKVFDFEFIQKGKIKTSKLKGCYAWYGVPDDFSGDRPQGKYYLDPYRSKWFVQTGLPRFLCVYDIPVPVLHFIRILLLLIISLYILVKKTVLKSLKAPLILFKKVKIKIKHFIFNI